MMIFFLIGLAFVAAFPAALLETVLSILRVGNDNVSRVLRLTGLKLLCYRTTLIVLSCSEGILWP